jgi:hypothetical protein
MHTGSPVRPEGQKEVAVLLQRNSAQNIGQRGAEEDNQQSAGKAEDAIEQVASNADVDVVA